MGIKKFYRPATLFWMAPIHRVVYLVVLDEYASKYRVFQATCFVLAQTLVPMPQLIAALMRHGAYHQPDDTPSAHLPYPLTVEGQDQARAGTFALLDTVTSRDWRLYPVIDSSTLLRAWQTAQTAASELDHASVESFDALAERSVGSAANLTVQQIEDVIDGDPRHDALPAGWKSNSHVRLPFVGAESLIEAGERVAEHLKTRIDRLKSQAKGTVVKLFVGHGGAFRHAAAALGVMSLEEARARSMYYGGVVFIEAVPGGAWRHVAGDWKMRRSADEALN